jgi:protein O-mannosyl-transferase
MNSKATTIGSIGYQLKSVTVLTCIGILAFWATFHSPFLYDDAHAIVENPYIQSLNEYQSKVGIENIFNRSVLLLTFALNREIGGLDVFGYHLTNILIHILTGLVLYFLVRELLLLERPPHRLNRLPLICAFIHLVNPLTVQTVTYISSRSSGLATFFYLIAFYIFCRLVRPGKEDPAWSEKLSCIIGICIFLFLGVGTKEIVVTFPFMAIVYIWLITPAEQRKSLKAKIGIILLPLFLFLIYRYLEKGSIFSFNADPVSGETSRYLYFLSQIKVAVHYYLLKLILPFNLNFEPDIRLISGVMDGQLFFSIGVLITGAILVFRRKSSLLIFAVLWFFITLLPSSSIIPLKQIATEHRTYLPGIGFSLILGWVFLNTKRPQALTICLFIVFLSIYFLLTVNRSLDYRSEIMLWKDTAQKSPNKALAHNNLATAYMEEKMFEEAKSELSITLGLNPSQSDAYANLGHIHFQSKNWDKAIQELDRSIFLGSNKPDTYYFSGLARSNRNRKKDAVPFLQKAISLRPHKAQYHFDLGEIYRQLEYFDEALHEFRQVIDIQPEHPQAQNNIGVIFWNLNAYDQAEIAFKKALNIQQNLPETHNNLAALYLIKNRYAKAIPHLEQVIKLQPDNLKVRKLLNHSLNQIKRDKK